MSFFLINDRNRANQNKMFNPQHVPSVNYSMDARFKAEMKQEYSEDMLLNNFHLIPDPLKKNLADTLVIHEMVTKTEKPAQETMPATVARDNSTLAGITSFFSGVFSMLSSAMFRPRPADYYECFDADDGRVAPPSWHQAKTDVRNKNEVPERQCYQTSDSNLCVSDMNKDCRSAVAHCEGKLNEVRRLLAGKPIPQPSRLRRRPKKVFVEPGSVEERFEDAYSPEDFVSLANESFMEYYTPLQYHGFDLYESQAPKVQMETHEKVDIVKTLPDNMKENCNVVEEDDKHQVVTACEDKASRLKALLQERRKKNSRTTHSAVQDTKTEESEVPSPKTISNNKSKDKHHKNSHKKGGDKRRKCKLRRNIHEDMTFAHEIGLEDGSSVENSPTTYTFTRMPEEQPPVDITMCNDYFDEVTGRLHSTSVPDTEDFQIVFNDCPRRPRRVSDCDDCDSVDSFIVFEESPDSCYTSNDLFGDTSDSEASDSDSDSDVSDSGCSTWRLSNTLSQTVSNLTDDGLFAEECDEVDCAARRPPAKLCDEDEAPVTEHTGLLIDDARRMMRRNMPAKTVQFSSEPPKVHVMRVWAFAARQARAGHWERYALDRDRFKRRIADVDMALSWVLKPQHRSRVMFQRFMPWWNQQKRLEAAEKQLKETEEKLNKEAEEERARGETENDVTMTENRETNGDDVTATQNRVKRDNGGICENVGGYKGKLAVSALDNVQNTCSS